MLLTGNLTADECERVAKRASQWANRALRDDLFTLTTEDGRCVHVASIGIGWSIAIIWDITPSPGPAFERLRRVARVLAMALRDGRQTRAER